MKATEKHSMKSDMITKVTLEDFADASPIQIARHSFGWRGQKKMEITPNLITGKMSFTVEVTSYQKVCQSRVEKKEFEDLASAIEFYNEF